LININDKWDLYVDDNESGRCTRMLETTLLIACCAIIVFNIGSLLFDRE